MKEPELGGYMEEPVLGFYMEEPYLGVCMEEPELGVYMLEIQLEVSITLYMHIIYTSIDLNLISTLRFNEMCVSLEF